MTNAGSVVYALKIGTMLVLDLELLNGTVMGLW